MNMKHPPRETMKGTLTRPRSYRFTQAPLRLLLATALVMK